MRRENTDERNLVAAGIVLFHPDFDRLFRCINNLSGQTDTVILYNNGADVEKVDRWNQNNGINIIIVGSGENVGIAAALNMIMEKAVDLGVEWVLTLDQDSVVPAGMLSLFSDAMSDESVAIVCPQNIDPRRKYMKPVTHPVAETVKMCDTSGSCTRLSVWKELGKLDDWLFIDLVDNDFCKRIELKGYRIIRINGAVMDHKYGNIAPRRKMAERFFIRAGEILHSTNIQKLSFKRIVNPMRVYYENRNILYLNKKYKKYGGVGYNNHHCKTYLGFFLLFSMYSWLVSDRKRDVFLAIRNGIRDGKRSEPEPWTP